MVVTAKRKTIKERRRERVLPLSDQKLLRVAEIGCSYETDLLIKLIDRLVKEIDRVQTIVRES